jgi:hypothetical protein
MVWNIGGKSSCLDQLVRLSGSLPVVVHLVDFTTVLAQELKWEGLILLAVFFYIGITFYGKSYNAKIANKWCVASSNV